jgi:hypothetical protein
VELRVATFMEGHSEYVKHNETFPSGHVESLRLEFGILYYALQLAE